MIQDYNNPTVDMEHSEQYSFAYKGVSTTGCEPWRVL